LYRIIESPSKNPRAVLEFPMVQRVAPLKKYNTLLFFCRHDVLLNVPVKGQRLC